MCKFSADGLARVTKIVWLTADNEVRLFVGDKELMPSDGQHLRVVTELGIVLDLLQCITGLEFAQADDPCVLYRADQPEFIHVDDDTTELEPIDNDEHELTGRQFHDHHGR